MICGHVGASHPLAVKVAPQPPEVERDLSMPSTSSTPTWRRPIEVVTGRPTRTRLEGGEIVVEISGRGLGWIEIKRCEHRGAEREEISR